MTGFPDPPQIDALHFRAFPNASAFTNEFELNDGHQGVRGEAGSVPPCDAIICTPAFANGKAMICRWRNLNAMQSTASSTSNTNQKIPIPAYDSSGRCVFSSFHRMQGHPHAAAFDHQVRRLSEAVPLSLHHLFDHFCSPPAEWPLYRLASHRLAVPPYFLEHRSLYPN